MFKLIDKAFSLIIVTVIVSSCLNNLYSLNVREYEEGYYSRLVCCQLLEKMLKEYGVIRLFHEAERGALGPLLQHFLQENGVYEYTIIVVELGSAKITVGAGRPSGTSVKLVLFMRDQRMVLNIWFTK